MTQRDVAALLHTIDDIEAQLRGCEQSLTSVRHTILLLTNSERALNANGDLIKPPTVTVDKPCPF